MSEEALRRIRRTARILLLGPDDLLLLFRYIAPGFDPFWIMAGGECDAHEDFPGAARRELLEETGCEARAIEPIGMIHPNPAIQSNACWSFVARGVREVATPTLDAAEDIDVVRLPLAEIPARIAAGEVRHSLVVVAFAWLLGLRTPVGSVD